MSNDVTAGADLAVIRYSQVWEDHAVLTSALRIGPDDDVLSICSAGCNALACLLAGARRVVAIDISAAQAALFRLKLAAIAHLDHTELLVLLGVEPGDAVAAYTAVRSHLDEETRGFWDARHALLAEGVVHSGRLERYFRGFQTEHLARLVEPGVIERLVSFTDVAAQGAYFDAHVDSPAFEAAYIAYFGQENLANRGRDPAQFRHVTEGDVGAVFLGRLRALCHRVLLSDSPYMTYFFTGRFPEDARRVAWLRRENHQRLRDTLSRVEVVVTDLGAYLDAQPHGAFSKANLSDIFEYMSADDTAALMDHLARRMRAGGRLAYWNLLVDRSSAERVPSLVALADEARRLHQTDRIFFYGAFHIDEVIQP